jgi:hypothetical protein
LLNSNSTGRKVKENRKVLSILCSLCLCKHKTCCISYHGFRTFLAWSCPVRKTTNSFFSIFCFLFEFKLEQKNCRSFFLSVWRLKWGICSTLLTSRWVMTGCISSLLIHLKIHYLAPAEHRTESTDFACFVELLVNLTD